MLLVGVMSCATSRRSAGIPETDRALADSLLAYALDHEAIYSLLDTLKPISSVKLLRFPVAKDSSLQPGAATVVKGDAGLREIERYQRLCRALSTGDWQFILAPFHMTVKGERHMEIYVIRKSRFASVLRQFAPFFGQWGFTSSADPAVVLATIEYESPLDRFRGYGYLFGYPEYAVDFFVESSRAADHDPAKKLVPRDFFSIPVFAGKSGYFTYAMPKGHQPGAPDSALYRQAGQTLEKYRMQRERYQTETGLRATALWKAWNREK